MSQYRINVQTPWGKTGDIMTIDGPLDNVKKAHLNVGNLTQLTEGVDYEAPFRPNEHTVEEVQEYLEGADPDETARVLAEEKMGKARKSLLSDEDDD